MSAQRTPAVLAVRRCCQVAMFVQAMVINLTPLLFIPLQGLFGLTFEQLGRLVLVNFVAQMIVDLICTAVVDRFGLVRPLTIVAQLFSVVGLWLFACAELLFPESPYSGLLLGTVVFSVGCGLIEVLVSPIIQALPSTHKESEMAFLHAFYPIGKVVVIAFTALALWLLGHSVWVWIVLGWSLVPLANTAAFLRVEIPPIIHEAHRERTGTMARTPIFWLCLLGILLAGAAEVTLAQWTSAFAQAALKLPQVVADWAGFGLFAAMMVAGRLWFGLRGHTMRIPPLLIGGAAITAICYWVAALAGTPWLSLGACVAAGFFVSMLWPGIVSLSAAAFPRAGISLFALLAASGDSGAGGGPWMVGAVADSVTAVAERGSWSLPPWLPASEPAAVGLRGGLLLAGVFPALLVLVLWMIAKLGIDDGRSP